MKNEYEKVVHTLLCLGMCLIWFSITLLLKTSASYPLLLNNGMLMPVLCTMEFCILVPLYLWYTRRYQAIPLGKLRGSQMLLFGLLLLGLIALQSLYMQQESWTHSQLGQGEAWRRTLAFSVAVVLLAPFFEEIIFRGFLLESLLIWAPEQRFACALLTSLAFAAMHTQYTHPQTLIALIALSLLLCYARMKSGGLKLPVALHMLNNALGVAPALWLSWQR
ncbi:CPBP family intramembrane glutamic endopeptidase [Pantoea sp. CCBC3-3-1]|uniref:CPBP family intramembrane glutamic endopeptidase n=1 Tax=Pantoea sp. CCBC3-3-1 TaxID=2490851 RepID=UPI0011BED72C|nr:CPBP family intramembrane glutamic endopeptidase [Pantoea sp. CCBC3-3-1]